MVFTFPPMRNTMEMSFGIFFRSGNSLRNGNPPPEAMHRNPEIKYPNRSI